MHKADGLRSPSKRPDGVTPRARPLHGIGGPTRRGKQDSGIRAGAVRAGEPTRVVSVSEQDRLLAPGGTILLGWKRRLSMYLRLVGA